MLTENKEILDQLSVILRKSTFNENSKKTNTSLKDYDEFFSNKFFMIHVIRTGVSFELFELISSHTPFSEVEWANFLDISTKSLQRYKKTSKIFKSIQTEKIIELAEVTHIGVDIFGSLEKFKLWLNTPSYSLGNIRPIELLKDSYGKELVLSELVRIDHGILG